MTPRITTWPAGRGKDEKPERGDWVKLTANDQAIIKAAVVYAKSVAVEDSAIAKYADEILAKFPHGDLLVGGGSR